MRAVLVSAALAALASRVAHADGRRVEETAREFPVLCADSSLLPPAEGDASFESTTSFSRPRGRTSTHRGRATLAAFVPGILIHGSGHYAAGDTRTGNRLLLSSSIGAGLALAGGASLLFTGANRDVSEMGVPLLVSGLGIYGATWLADIYGSATGGTSLSRAVPPMVAVSMGYAHVADPQFDFQHFAVAQAELQWSRISLRPSLWAAADADNQRGRLEAGFSLYRNDKGTRIELVPAATYHSFGDDGFATRTFEASIAGQWNLRGLGPRLEGAFADLSIGFGHTTIDFAGAGVPNTGNGQVLGRVGFGVRLPGDGETAFYYDHRRDDFAGGLSPSDRRGSGFAGHLGLRWRQPLGERFAMRLGTELGSAWVAVGALETRWGQNP